MALYSQLLYSLSNTLGTTPGKEFQAALLAAANVQETTKRSVLFCLGDRPVGLTMRRMWAALSLFQRVCLCWQLTTLAWAGVSEEALQSLMSDASMDMALHTLGKDFPALVTTLVEERNRYLAASLRDAALAAARQAFADSRCEGKDLRRTCTQCGEEFPSRSAMFKHLKEKGMHAPAPSEAVLRPVRVVGVLGYGHLAGVLELLQGEGLKDIRTEELMCEVPNAVGWGSSIACCALGLGALLLSGAAATTAVTLLWRAGGTSMPGTAPRVPIAMRSLRSIPLRLSRPR
eukprot:NODE_16666_length_984_cov_1.871645.p1 GENE.NODE_16666_length_984_cov_1.871645~~NODE_16666_length_984_cov_1.871645.p1  ORF type:complete len:326 (-),score=113.55 NODE_16666_length_984_cov_1.871645:5-871(-)